MAKSKAQRESERQHKWPHVIATGGPFDGIKLIGPFANGDEALAYSDTHDFDGDWWLVPIEPKED